LGRIERRAQAETSSGHWARLHHLGSDPAAVDAAVEMVLAMDVGELFREIAAATTEDVGPWGDAAPETAAACYQHQDARAPIAEAVASRFSDGLHRTCDLEGQEWWTSPGGSAAGLAPLFCEYGHVYQAGQFTWAGLRTMSAPPAAVHEHLPVDMGVPIARWLLPVDPGARVFEIHRPGDWAELVQRYPSRARPDREGWELPGINQDRHVPFALWGVADQNAARREIRHHLVPDWAAVAEDFDGVHLSWAGVVTAEGFVNDLGHGDVSLLRYWFHEQTLWLADVFGAPEPLPAPSLDAHAAIDLPAEDTQALDRRRSDAALLQALLGRD
jgi:hypothetical protein